jgi:cytochrome P450
MIHPRFTRKGVHEVSATAGQISPLPPRAGFHLPRVGAAISLFNDPTEFFRRARRRHGDTFFANVLGRPLFCVFSAAGVRSLWALPESTASKGLADFEMLRHKVPDDLFAGRRILPHDLFSRDDVAEYLKNAEQATTAQLDELGNEGEFEVFDFTRRFGHRVGLASWGGLTRSSTRHLDRLIAALDALDSSESFVHPHRAIQTVLSGKRREKRALAELEAAYREILSEREESPAPNSDLFDRICENWGDTSSPDREIGIARDVVLVHMGSMSNLFAANAWTFIHLLDRPELFQAVRDGDDALLVRAAHESIRLRQRSIVLRRALRDFDFDDGERIYHIEAGVFLATTMAVTNPESLDGLDDFDPDNFDGARFVRRSELETPELVTTFGHGKHSCPAMRFSITTIQLLISALAREFDFEALYRDPRPLRRQIGGVARADRACRVRYRRRATR